MRHAHPWDGEDEGETRSPPGTGRMESETRSPLGRGGWRGTRSPPGKGRTESETCSSWERGRGRWIHTLPWAEVTLWVTGRWDHPSAGHPKQQTSPHALLFIRS